MIARVSAAKRGEKEEKGEEGMQRNHATPLTSHRSDAQKESDGSIQQNRDTRH